MDALQALRETILAKSPITFLSSQTPTPSLFASTHILLSSHPFPKSTPTRYQRPKASSTSTRSNDWIKHPEDFFPLQAVVLAYEQRGASTAEYLKAAREALGGTGFVSVTDRAPLVAWLEGSSERLERLVPLGGESTTPTGSPSLPTSSLPSTAPITGNTSAPSRAQQSLEKRPYAPDLKDLAAVKRIRLNEIEVKDRVTVLRGTKINDFTNVKNLMAERVKNAKDVPKVSLSASSSASSVSSSKTDPNAAKKKNRNIAPIIMISSSPTSLITMHNIRKFLEDAEYESPDAARARMTSEGNTKLDDVLPIYRKKAAGKGAGGGLGRGDGGGNAYGQGGQGGERPIKYFVVDGVEALAKFGTDAWDRVICVMTTGQVWQFRPYKWSDPTQLFHHVKGVYVAWSNDPANPKVKDWNVSELRIDPHRRHVDKMTVANFWMQIDEWLAQNKPWLVT